MTEYKPEHILGSMMELRDYDRLSRKAAEYTKEHGWSYVIEALKRCRESDAIVQGWDLKLREGILRDGMINLLTLEGFESLDVDLLNSFSGLLGNDLESLRESAKEIALELLKEQVKRGNTFFMDVELWKESDFAFHVPGIISSRTREIERLGPNPHLHEVYSTYYGFSMLTTDVNVEEAGVPATVGEELLRILQEVGGVRELSGKQLKFSTFAFRKCSPHQTALLWNLLRLSIGGIKYKFRALKTLGDLGDSRVIDSLHSFVEPRKGLSYRSREDSLVEGCLECLGRIGNPLSFDYMKNFGNGRANVALGGVREPRVLQDLSNQIDRSTGFQKKTMVYLIQSLGNSRSPLWLEFYERTRKLYKSKDVQATLEWAKRNVHPPYDE